MSETNKPRPGQSHTLPPGHMVQPDPRFNKKRIAPQEEHKVPTPQERADRAKAVADATFPKPAAPTPPKTK